MRDQCAVGLAPCVRASAYGGGVLMPQYEFECHACGEVFTVQQTFDEHSRHEAPTCPHCGSHDVEQLLGRVNVITSRKS